MKNGIYISGSVTEGIRNAGYISTFIKFDRAADKVRKSTGRVVVNPMGLCCPRWSWLRCMAVCLYNLARHCDTIYMLPDWECSKGAQTELKVAKRLKMEVIYEESANV